MTVKSFRDLRVWQGSMELVERVYACTASFPTREVYGLASQMRRAAVSVPSNIAEGHTRAHNKEFLHHISIAHGSLAELQTQIEIAARLAFIPNDDAGSLVELAMVLSKQLYALRNAVARSRRANPQPLSPNPQ